MKIFLVKWNFVYYSDQRCYPQYVRSLWTGHWYFWTELLISRALLCICLLPFFFQTWDPIYSFSYGAFIQKQRNGTHRYKINESKTILVLFHPPPSLPRYLQLHQSSNLVFTPLLHAKVFIKLDLYLLKNCR